MLNGLIFKYSILGNWKFHQHFKLQSVLKKEQFRKTMVEPLNKIIFKLLFRKESID